MESVTVKELWRAVFASPDKIRSYKRWLLALLIMGVFIGLMGSIDKFDRGALLESLKVCGRSILFGLVAVPMFFFAFYLVITLVLTIFSMPFKSYTFSVENGRFLIWKKTLPMFDAYPVLDIPLASYLNHSFVVLTANRPMGSNLEIHFLNDAGRRDGITVNIAFITDEDNLRLQDFMTQLDALKSCQDDKTVTP